MKHIDIKFKHNGYVVTFFGFLKDNGEMVYKTTEELQLVEDIGKALLGKKIEAKER
jgi:hypothetical protein